MNVKYVVDLTAEERWFLEDFVRRGKPAARSIKRAMVLLAANDGQSDAEIAQSIRVGSSTVYRTKRLFVEEGLERALREAARRGGPRKLAGKDEALLVALACTRPPEGRANWTMQLLADSFVEFTDHTSLSRETVRRRLSEQEIKPWQRKMWCIPNVDYEYLARMEDVLDLYAEPMRADQPVICFDESPVQLVAETREKIPAARGRPERIDFEYRRNGTANLFVYFDRHAGWRHVKVTSRRTSADFAECMRELVDIHYPAARCIRVVLDNLSTHTSAALYQTFPPNEARRILRRIKFHYVPKHASWLNMVEIEIGVLKSQCLSRRIGTQPELEREVAAWQRSRNLRRATIEWRFTIDRAREKLKKLYPQPEVRDHQAA